NAVTSREFPVILFDAGGTLLHPNPPFEKIYREALAGLGYPKTDQEIDEAMLRSIRFFNEASERDENFELKPSLWAESMLRELNIEAKIAPQIRQVVSAQAKMVIAQSTVDICSTLKDRGYRLGIVSNWNGILADVIRGNDLLDLFDSIITSVEVGAYKPRSKIFEEAIHDIDISPEKVVFIGESFAADMLGAKKLEMKRILYDPKFRELRALLPEDTSGKVVSIETLKHNRRLDDIRVITRFEELLEIFL
ncbi:MAG: hydrolase, partial [Bacteriovoracaceae bacterium]|nr:hydrolase [Bacteriovoracaceae bacterium]